MHPDEALARASSSPRSAALLLGICVFLPWYEPNPDNPNAIVAGVARERERVGRPHDPALLLPAAAIAPLILLYIVLRDHELSWPRGEMTAVIAIAAFGFIGYVGIIDRPGEPTGEISLGYGWFGAMLGVILMAVGGAMRAGGTERPRKPPGVL